MAAVDDEGRGLEGVTDVAAGAAPLEGEDRLGLGFVMRHGLAVMSFVVGGTGVRRWRDPAAIVPVVDQCLSSRPW